MFEKGDHVLLALTGAGYTTFDSFFIKKVNKNGAWLDNGPGNDPTGPFDTKTGEYKGDMMPGFMQKIMPEPK
jgi:hypothetical protein